MLEYSGDNIRFSILFHIMGYDVNIKLEKSSNTSFSFTLGKAGISGNYGRNTELIKFYRKICLTGN